MVKTYHRPERIDEVLKLMSDPQDKNVPLAGGTILALNPRGVDGLVDLAALNLSYIRPGDPLRIGATTPIREIQRSEHVRQFARVSVSDASSADVSDIGRGVLAESAKNYLTALIRNRATLGGVLAAGNFWADIATVLVALNASLKIMIPTDPSGQHKPAEVSVEDFVRKGARKTLAGGILQEVMIPACGPADRCVYNRLAKVETDISILSGAAKITLSGKTIRSASIVIGNGSRPVRLKNAEEQIRGMTPSAAVAVVSAAAMDIPADSDIRASAEYRKTVAGVLAGRLLRDLI